MREQIIEQILSFVNLVLLPCTDGLVDQCYIPSYPMCTKVFVNSVSSWLTFYKNEKHSRKICQCHGCLCSFGHFDQKAKSCVCNVHIHNITFKYTIQLINLTMIMTSQMSNQNFVCKWKFTNHQMQCNLVYDILDKKVSFARECCRAKRHRWRSQSKLFVSATFRSRYIRRQARTGTRSSPSEPFVINHQSRQRLVIEVHIKVLHE